MVHFFIGLTPIIPLSASGEGETERCEVSKNLSKDV